MNKLLSLIPLFLLSLYVPSAAAATVSWYGPGFGGAAALIILILDIIAIVEVLQSGRPMTEKLLWILFILFFPLISLIVYWYVVCLSYSSFRANHVHVQFYWKKVFTLYQNINILTSILVYHCIHM